MQEWNLCNQFLFLDFLDAAKVQLGLRQNCILRVSAHQGYLQVMGWDIFLGHRGLKDQLNFCCIYPTKKIFNIVNK